MSAKRAPYYFDGNPAVYTDPDRNDESAVHAWNPPPLTVEQLPTEATSQEGENFEEESSYDALQLAAEAEETFQEEPPTAATFLYDSRNGYDSPIRAGIRQ